MFDAGAIVGSMRLGMTDWTRGVSRVKSDVGGLGTLLSSLGRIAIPVAGIVGVGLAVKKVIGIVKEMAKAAVEASIKFESSFAGVRKTIDATEKEFDRIRKQFIQMSLEIPINVNEINRLGEAAGQLGIKIGNLEQFTRTIALLGVTTTMSSEEAAFAMARWANITQLPQNQIDRLGSTVVDLGNNLATTEGEIVQMGLRLTGVGKLIGMTDAAIAGMAGALSSVGLHAEMAGSAMSKIMSEIAMAVETSGESLRIYSSLAGKTSAEFSTLFKQDSIEAILQVIEGLGNFSEAGGSALKVLQAIGMEDIRTRDTLLRVAGAGDLVRDSIVRASSAWQENTALVNEANKRFETSESKMELMKNKAEALKITFGDKLKPAIDRVSESMGNLFDKMTKVLESWDREPFKKFGADAAVRQQASMGLYDLQQLGGMKPAKVVDMSGITEADLLAGVLPQANVGVPKAVGETSAQFAGKIVEETKAIAESGQANIDKINEAIQSVGDSASSASSDVVSLGDSGLDLWNSLDLASGVVSELSENIKALSAAGKMGGAAEWLLAEGIWIQLKDAAPDAIEATISGIKSVSPAVAEMVVQYRDGARTIFAEQQQLAERGRDLWRAMTPGEDLFQSAVEGIQQLQAAGLVDESTPNLLGSYMWERFQNVSGAAMDAAISKLLQLGGVASEVGQSMRDTMASEWIVDVASQVGGWFDGTQEKVEQTKVAIGESISELGARINGIGDSIRSNVATNLGAAVSSLGSFMQSLETARKAFKALKDVGGDSASNVLSSVLGMTSGVLGAVGAVASLGQAFGLFGEESVEELKGVDKMMEELGDKLDEWADRLTDTIVDFVKTGKASFREFVDSVLEDMLQLSIRNLVVGPVFDAIGGAFAKGGAYTSTGIIPLAKGHVTNGPEFFTSGGKRYVRGEAGQEGVVPLRRMGNGDLGVQALTGGGGGDVQVIVNDYRSSGEAVQVSEQSGPDGKRQILVTIRDAIAELAGDGQLDRIMSTNWRLRRQPV